MKKNIKITLTDAQRKRLLNIEEECWINRPNIGRRARVLLSLANGQSIAETASHAACTTATVYLIIQEWIRDGMGCIDNRRARWSWNSTVSYDTPDKPRLTMAACPSCNQERELPYTVSIYGHESDVCVTCIYGMRYMLQRLNEYKSIPRKSNEIRVTMKAVTPT